MDTNVIAPAASWSELEAHGRVSLTPFEKTSNGCLRGSINLVDAGRVVGWAQDVNTPDRPLRLKILIGGVVVGHAVACLYREELHRAGLGNGRHGFDAVLPNRLGGTGILEVRREADEAILDSWPAGRVGRRLLEDSALAIHEDW